MYLCIYLSSYLLSLYIHIHIYIYMYILCVFYWKLTAQQGCVVGAASLAAIGCVDKAASPRRLLLNREARVLLKRAAVRGLCYSTL